MLTIFTPTYNRKETLPRLYQSLLLQSNKNFIWLLVDDGSTDGTFDLVNKWISIGLIEIEYYFQENQGKSMAHNLGVKNSKTELFTCVDSDDYLVGDAVEQIISLWSKSTKDYTGILALKKNINSGIKNTIITTNSSTLKDLYKNKEISGDVMLIYRTELIKKYNFPRFGNEKFVPEAYLYDLLDREGNLLILNNEIYCYEYLSDGYTKNMFQLLKNNPKGYLAFIEQRISFNQTYKEIFFDGIRYVSMALVLKKRGIISKSKYPLIIAFSYPFGAVLYLKRYKYGLKR